MKIRIAIVGRGSFTKKGGVVCYEKGQDTSGKKISAVMGFVEQLKTAGTSSLPYPDYRVRPSPAFGNAEKDCQ